MTTQGTVSGQWLL